MRLTVVTFSLLAMGALGCEVSEPPAFATGVDITLPDGASLALDGAQLGGAQLGGAQLAEPPPPSPGLAADMPTAAEVRATSPAPLARRPAVARFQGGTERGSAQGAQATETVRRYHLAWVRLSVAQPDGSTIVSQFHRATAGPKYWADTATRVVRPGDAVPLAP